MKGKTPYLKVKPDNIPQELKRRNQWVCWEARPKDGKYTKVPFNPKTGRKAKSNDPDTWGSFSEAYAHYQRNGFDGIGFALSENDPFTGWDFDHCRNRQTGEIDFAVQQIIKRLNSYSEISPSGTGVRVFVKATLPEGRRKKGNIEAYHSGRYLTLTGHRI